MIETPDEVPQLKSNKKHQFLDLGAISYPSGFPIMDSLRFNFASTVFILYLLLGLPWAHTFDDPRFKESLVAYSRKDFTKAIQLLLPLVEENPKKSIYWFNLANSQFMSKQYVAATGSFDQVIKLNTKLSDISFVYKAKALKKLGRHEEAIQVLLKAKSKPNISSATKVSIQTEQAILETISTVETDSLTLYQAAQWQKSENKLKTLDVENLSKNGRILMGLVLLKQKKFNEAEQFIQPLTQSSKPSSQTAAQTNDVLRELLKKARQKDSRAEQKWVFLDFSYGQTNNVYFEGKSGSQVSSSIIRSTLGAGYHFNSENRKSQKIGYTFSVDDPKQAPDLTTYSHTLQTSVHLDDSLRSLSAAFFFSSQSLSYSLASEKLGTNLKAVYSLGESETILSADLSKLVPRQDSLNFLGGHSYSLHAAYGQWRPATYGQVNLTLGQEQIGDLTSADGSLLPMRQNYYGVGMSGLWNFSLKGCLAAGLSLTQHKYTNQEIPDSKNRSDDEINVFVKVTYSVTPLFLFYFAGEQKNNRSNLGPDDAWDKNYDVNIISAGVTWDGI